MKAILVITIDLDCTPGTMHTEESAADVVQDTLTQRLGHYNPVVSLTTTKE